MPVTPTNLTSFTIFLTVFDVFLAVLAFLLIIWGIFAICLLFSAFCRFSYQLGYKWTRFDQKRQKHHEIVNIDEYTSEDTYKTIKPYENGRRTDEVVS